VKKRHFWTSIVGNILEHYDNALFGMLAPFLAPLFFPNHSPIAGLISTYGLLAIGLFSKPLGALFFGAMGDRFGIRKALSTTLVGMAIVTTLIGCLPTYRMVGPLAPFLLGMLRFFQAFFSAGETPGGALYLLERVEEGKKSFFSSLYDCSSIAGIFLASLIVTLVGFRLDGVESLWRLPFFIGSLCGFFGLLLRRGGEEEPIGTRSSIRSHFHAVWEYRLQVLPIVFVAGFSYAVYTFSVTLMNGYLPLVSTISKQQASALNTFLLLLDFLLLPLFGLLAQRWGKERLMMTSCIGTILLSIPLFSLLNQATIQGAFFVRFTLITGGVAFAAAYHHWAQERVPSAVRFTAVATATALGAQLIGKPSALIALWLFQKTGWVFAPALYLVAAGLAAFASLRVKQSGVVQTNL
jgi:MHS family proline/betaine transporter-like MFS transporter